MSESETNEVKPKLPSWRDTYSLSSLKIPLLGLAVIVGAFFLESQYRVEEEEVSVKLAPNAIYISNRIGVSYTETENEDVNEDGTLESVLYIKNPVTDKYEQRLIEQDGDQLRLRKFEVVDGEIKYLDDCLK
jgi:hypothetical protein